MAAAQACLPYGDATTLLAGAVYAMEAFDEAETESIERTRQADYYALVMPERICVQATDGGGAAYHVSLVRLDMPAEMAKMVLQKRVLVQGPLAAGGGPDADPPVVMKVTGLAAQ